MSESPIKVGQVFVHRRKITKERTPEVCVITRVAQGYVWYRVGGKDGAKCKAPIAPNERLRYGGFEVEEVLEWDE